MEDINRQLAAGDAALDEKIRNQYPVTPFEQIKCSYPDQWVAVATVEVGTIGQVARGRLFAAAPNRKSLLRKIKAFRKKYPGVVLIDHFTGEYRDTGRLIA